MKIKKRDLWFSLPLVVFLLASFAAEHIKPPQLTDDQKVALGCVDNKISQVLVKTLQIKAKEVKKGQEAVLYLVLQEKALEAADELEKMRFCYNQFVGSYPRALPPAPVDDYAKQLVEFIRTRGEQLLAGHNQFLTEEQEIILAEDVEQSWFDLEDIARKLHRWVSRRL
ncbi:hypothetical protein ACQU0X_27025 [Pseudovibrio ascidiaceicola]|uniref:hypothetical protein n=1 Tax=Pseudovibrio ascidiaceicola TaxID=285279 RepID=UPI003D360520